MKDEGLGGLRDLRAGTKDFIDKLERGLPKRDETDLWLELPADAGTIKSTRIKPLRVEVDEWIANFVTMIRKIKGRR